MKTLGAVGVFISGVLVLILTTAASFDDGPDNGSWLPTIAVLLIVYGLGVPK